MHFDSIDIVYTMSYALACALNEMTRRTGAIITNTVCGSRKHKLCGLMRSQSSSSILSIVKQKIDTSE